MYEIWFMDEKHKYVSNMNMLPTHCIIHPRVYNKLIEIIKNKVIPLKIDLNNVTYSGVKIKTRIWSWK